MFLKCSVRPTTFFYLGISRTASLKFHSQEYNFTFFRTQRPLPDLILTDVKSFEIQELIRNLFLALFLRTDDRHCCASSAKSLKQGARCLMVR